MSMQATALAGRINPDMTDKVIPMAPDTRKGVIDQLKNSPTGGVVLRPRPDMGEFAQRDHASNRAAKAVEQYEANGSVLVVIDRPVAKTRHGNKEVPTFLRIDRDGTLVNNVEMAVGILDRYPTCIEEVPDGEVVHAPDARDEEIARLRAELAGKETTTDAPAETEVPAVAKKKRRS